MTDINDGATSEVSLVLTVHHGRVKENQRTAPVGETVEEAIAIPDDSAPHGSGEIITNQPVPSDVSQPEETAITAEINKSMVHTMA